MIADSVVMGRKLVVAGLLSFLLLSAAYFSHIFKVSFRSLSRTRTSQEDHSPPGLHLDSTTLSAAPVHTSYVYAVVDVKNENPEKAEPDGEVVHLRFKTVSQTIRSPTGSATVAPTSGTVSAASAALPTQSVATLPRDQHLSQKASESLKFNPRTNLSAPLAMRTAVSITTPQGVHNSDKKACKDALCTQYLTEGDRQRFRECTSHVSARGKLLKNGTCRFMNGTARPKVALASFPGSGNTWVRGLLEAATGICTGAIYCDSVLRSAGFNGEYVVGSSVLAVKTHGEVHDFQAAIHLVRSPDKAIVSEWNRHTGAHHEANGGGRHTAVASPEQFGDSQEWDTFLHEYFKRWVVGVRKMAKFQQKWPVLHVFYEDLQVNTTHEVERMLDFLGIPYSSQELQWRLRDGFQKLHRQHNDKFNPFTTDQHVFMKVSLYHLEKDLRKEGFEDSADFVQKYI